MTTAVSMVATSQGASALATAGAFGPNDRVRAATIGMGIIGFIDMRTALKVPGVELVADADVYEGRRVHAREVFGTRVDACADYREILAGADDDAGLLCVPNHLAAGLDLRPGPLRPPVLGRRDERRRRPARPRSSSE